MPYRRLPNTDDARIRSLRNAIKHDEVYGNSLAFSLKLLEEARGFLLVFERAQFDYKFALKEQVNSNQKYKELIKQSKLYISHFIQVLNLAVVREEIKPELKSLYGLSPENNSVPEMLNDDSILEWGEKIIKGELDRLSRGGSPIYNPAIAKVRVHYDMFKEAYHRQKIYQQNTSRKLENLSLHRDTGDRIILEIWNEVEDTFKDLPPEDRLNKCKEYGIIYYYRRGEKEKMTDATVD